MEEERIISLTARNSLVTAEFLFKGLFIATGKFTNFVLDVALNPKRIFNSETEWNKFMKSLDPITIKDLKNNEINLDKFKEELKKYGIGFSFYKHPDGETVSMAFSIKHKDIVEKALSDTIEKMVKEDDFVEKTKKKPEDKTLTEKLKYYENEQKEQKAKKDMNNKKDREAIIDLGKIPKKGEKSR